MGLLVDVNLLEVGVEGVWEPGGNEGGLRVVGETLSVEGTFKVFKGEGVVKLKGWLDEK